MFHFYDCIIAIIYRVIIYHILEFYFLNLYSCGETGKSSFECPYHNTFFFTSAFSHKYPRRDIEGIDGGVLELEGGLHREQLLRYFTPPAPHVASQYITAFPLSLSLSLSTDRRTQTWTGLGQKLVFVVLFIGEDGL